MAAQVPTWFWCIVAAGAVKVAVGVPGFGWPAAPSRDSPFPAWIYLITLLAFAVAGATLLLGGRRDRRALLLGGIFVLVASMAADRPLARLELHGPSALAYVAGVLRELEPGAFRPLLVWMFARTFPRDALVGRWRQFAQVGQTLCTVLGIVLFGISAGMALDAMRPGVLAWPDGLLGLAWDDFANVHLLFVTPLTLIGLPLIVLNMRAAGRSDQRRAEVFVAGLVLGTAPVLAEAAAENVFPVYDTFMSGPTALFWKGIVLYPLLFSGLAVAAYSVYVGQVLSVRLVVRKAVRYAFARASLIVLVLAPFLLLSRLMYLHRAEPLGTLLTGPSQIALFALVVGAALILATRRRLLEALDRRFFREQYDARLILADLIESGRSAKSLDVLAAHVTSEIDRALHVASAALYVRHQTALAFSPVSGGGEPLRHDSTLATLLKGSGRPMDISLAAEDGTLSRLPAAERAWVTTHLFDLLVPVNDGQGELRGFIALGPKKSELPFSREDRWLLSATASSAALALEHLEHQSEEHANTTHNRAVADDGARECGKCGLLFPADIAACTTCQVALHPANVPLLLRSIQFERRIAVGGMGVVYLGIDRTLRRRVAIKTLPALSSGDAHQLRREARAMAALSHPNLATIYTADVWRDTPLLIAEYLDGGMLRDALQSGPLGLSQALALGVDLAAALDHMHNRGILHRDIKPSNIGFTGSGTPKLLDFGLAKLVMTARSRDEGATNDGTTAGWDISSQGLGTASVDTFVGTPAYFSPELVLQSPPDYASDLWALALTLYEAISGVNPMAGRSTADTLERIITSRVPSLDTVRRDCPPNIAAFFARALHHQKDERPESARQLVTALTELRRAVPGV